MSTKERAYYEQLTRTDHPVFYKDFSETINVNSPLNSILNLIFAKQLARFRDTLEELRLNTYPNLVTSLTIDDWEFEYFGFTKPNLSLDERVSELLIKVNRRLHLNVGDVIDLSRAITGLTPSITRNVNKSGWVLGSGALGVSTILAGGSSANGLYLVYFSSPLNTDLLTRIDEKLTVIEKAGSRHKVMAVIPRWVLGKAPLGINTTLGDN